MHNIELIPAIDIIGGKCVRLTRGDYQQVATYNADGSVQCYIEVLSDSEGRFISDLKYGPDGTMIEGDVYTYGADGSTQTKTTYKNGRIWAVFTYTPEGTKTEYFE